MSLLRLLTVVISFSMSACDKMDTIVISERATGGKVFVKCSPRKIEIGLHLASSYVPDRVNGDPINKIVLKSRIKIYDAETKREIVDSSSDSPIVYWMSEKRIGYVEYIGLQEIALPFSISCRNYDVDIEHAALPDWLFGADNSPIHLYVRESKRP